MVVRVEDREVYIEALDRASLDLPPFCDEIELIAAEDGVGIKKQKVSPKITERRGTAGGRAWNHSIRLPLLLPAGLEPIAA